ncbi:hypothetical protein F383_34833 [Gossypium arboreum]|uniref:Uncharacterized protein n=1 Tax=Gossypium arboreum TaxID=29729 RepID=A0A0B0N9V7_GOSAR|nr:hypothetical protein F383_34833 [Gossypium arboreum]
MQVHPFDYMHLTKSKLKTFTYSYSHILDNNYHIQIIW